MMNLPEKTSKKRISTNPLRILIPVALALALAACDSSGASSDQPANGAIGKANTSNGGGPAPSNGAFPSCVTSDPNHICIGVKVVSYKDSSGAVVLSQDAAITVIQQINQIWQTCNVGFQIEEYTQVDPTAYGLSYGAASENELTQVRQTFANDTTFLIAATGPWTTSTIAWTEMPGGAPYGVVVDSDYSTQAVAVGHELGHYQGLDHVNTSGNLMYPIVYTSDTNIDSSQCATATSTDQSFWSHMLRK